MGNTFNSYNVSSADANGIGGAGLDGTATTGTSTVWRALRFSPRVDNDIASANPLLLVQAALHELRQTAGV
jgi:hypothetical protein